MNMTLNIPFIDNSDQRNLNHGAESPVSLDSMCMSEIFDVSLSENSEANVTTVNQQHDTNQLRSTGEEEAAKNKPKPKKVYTCSYCQKVFNRPSALQTHIYSHTAEKPFQCSSPNCGRYFSVVSNLRRHLKVHQKTQTSNKLSSEDRLRCVKRLMLKSSVLLNQEIQGMKYNNMSNNTDLPKQVSQQHRTNRKYHFPILPAVTSPTFQNQYHVSGPHMYLPSPPLRFAPSFENQPIEGDGGHDILSRNNLFGIPQPWQSHYEQAVDPYNSCLKDIPIDNSISYKSNVQSNRYSRFIPYNLHEIYVPDDNFLL